MSEPEGGGHGAGEPKHEGGWGETIYNMATRGMHIAEGVMDAPKIFKMMQGAGVLAKGAKLPGILGTASKFLKGGGAAVPIIGGLMSAGSAAYNGYEAYQNFSKGGYHCDKAWNNVGGTLLGGAGVGLAAAYCTPAAPYAAAGGAALAVGEIGADLTGKAAGKLFGDGAEFSADNIVGGLARGTFGDKSWGEGLSNMLGGGVGGHIAGTALNALSFPAQLASTAVGGVASEIGAIGKGIWNGEGLVGEGVHAIGHGIGSAASAVGSGISSAASFVGGGLSSAAHAVGSILPSGW